MDCQMIYNQANLAGLKAAEACRPTPMVVVQWANPFDDNSPIVKQYEPCMGGVCGFAWVNIKPANSAFAKFMKLNHRCQKSYEGGISYWIHMYNQSMELKTAYADAFAKVLQENGIRAYANSRMD